MNGKEEIKGYRILAGKNELEIHCCNSLVLSIALSSLLKHTDFNIISIIEEK